MRNPSKNTIKKLKRLYPKMWAQKSNNGLKTSDVAWQVLSWHLLLKWSKDFKTGINQLKESTNYKAKNTRSEKPTIYSF